MSKDYTPLISIIIPFLIFGGAVGMLYRHPKIKRYVVIHLLIFIFYAIITLSSSGLGPLMIFFYAWCHAAFVLLYILIYKLRKSKGNKQTATHIETQHWYAIIELLKDQGWKVTREYIAFDKGIDYDHYVLKLNGEKILFSWDNLDEGKIQCSKRRMKKLENEFKVNFKCK